jgi:hypothetical protein
MDEIKETGGARIGMANATWPFAKLLVNKDRLEIKASIIGNLAFKPSDVISIRPYTIIPVLGQGIKIVHNVSNYDPNVIFWTMGSPAALISRIEATGFTKNLVPLSTQVEQEIISAQAQGGFPIKTPAIIAIVVIWNLLLLPVFINFSFGKQGIAFSDINIQLALGFMFCTCLVLLVSHPFRKLLLKPGASIDNIKSFLFFLMLITAIIFLGFSFFPK